MKRIVTIKMHQKLNNWINRWNGVIDPGFLFSISRHTQQRLEIETHIYHQVQSDRDERISLVDH